MLELGFTHDAMAQLLNVEVAEIVRWSVGNYDIPTRYEKRVHILLGEQRADPAYRPVTTLARNLLVMLANHGSQHLDAVTRQSGLSWRHLRNIQQIEGWITIVWEEGRSHDKGRHAYVYLTGAGYKELGLAMPIDAEMPPTNAALVVNKDLDNAAQELLEILRRQADSLRDALYQNETAQLMLIRGYASTSQVVDMIEALTSLAQAEFPKITNNAKD